MRYIVIALIAYLAVAIQTTLADVVQIGRVSPQIPAMVAAAVVLLHRNNAALAIAMAIGLYEDALWPGRMGVAMGWYLILSWGLLDACERFDLGTLSRRIAATGMFAGLLALCIGTTRFVLGEPTVGLLPNGAQAAGIGLYTAAAAVPLWLVLSWCEKTRHQHLARYEV